MKSQLVYTFLALSAWGATAPGYDQVKDACVARCHNDPIIHIDPSKATQCQTDCINGVSKPEPAPAQKSNNTSKADSEPIKSSNAQLMMPYFGIAFTLMLSSLNNNY